MDVDHFRIDSVCCKLLCCFQTVGNRKSCCHDSQIFSFAQHNTFSEFELVIFSVIDHRNRQTSKTHINRSYMLVSRFYCCSCFYIIRRVDHNHSRNCSHQSDIFVTLVCRTVFSYRDSCMCRTDLHVQFRVSDGVSDLLKCTACRKHCERACKWYLSGCCKTCCHTHHITLCDTTVDKSLRMCFFKHTGLCSCRKVCIQYNYILMCSSEFG